MLLKINGNEYKIKYGYRVLAKTNLVKDVMNMSNISDQSDANEMLDVVMTLLPRLLLFGLYKYNEEFRFDLDSEDELNSQLEKVYDLIDEYIDDGDGSVVDLFTRLTDEMVNNGFLSQKSQMVVDNIQKTPTKKK